MSESMEGIITAPQEITLKDALKDEWRGVQIQMIEERALEVAWGKGITGKRVDFPQVDETGEPNGKTIWGIEVNIPLRFDSVAGIYSEVVNELATEKNIQLSEDEIKQGTSNKKDRTWYSNYDFRLPDKIKEIKILDLHPQEMLPKGMRTIESQKDWFNGPNYTERTTRQSSDNIIFDRAISTFLSKSVLLMPAPDDARRNNALSDMFDNVFGDNKENVKLFNEKLEKSDASEIIFVHAHGGETNIIGEQNSTVKPHKVEIAGEQIDLSENQAQGNWIDLAQVVKEYDQPERFGAILVGTCYVGENPPPVNRVPVFRFHGKSTNMGNQWRFPTDGKSGSLVSPPSEIEANY